MPGKQLTREISRFARNNTYLVNRALLALQREFEFS
jgi:hypothetical protein